MRNNPDFEIKPINAFEPGSIVEIHTKNTRADKRPFGRVLEYRLAEAGVQPEGNMIVQMMKKENGVLVDDVVVNWFTPHFEVIKQSYAGNTKARAAIVYRI